MSNYKISSISLIAQLLSIPYAEAEVKISAHIIKMNNIYLESFGFYYTANGRMLRPYMMERILEGLGFNWIFVSQSTNIEQVMARLGDEEERIATYNQWIADRKKEKSKEMYAVLLTKRTKPRMVNLNEWVLLEGSKLVNYGESPSFLEEYGLQHWRVEYAFQIIR